MELVAAEGNDDLSDLFPADGVVGTGTLAAELIELVAAVGAAGGAEACVADLKFFVGAPPVVEDLAPLLELC